MINRIKNKIEKNRGSPIFFWFFLVSLKDIVYVLISSFGKFIERINFFKKENYKKYMIQKYGVFSYYLAHSKDKNIRRNASSGGFCKAMLLYLTEKKIVDYAIITRNVKNPFAPETIATNKREDIVSIFTNSIYSPTNPLKILSILKNNKTYAFVGLPCHCQKIQQLQKLGKYKNIKIIISLFCSHTPKIDYTYELLKKIGVEEEDVKYVCYRDGFWPGSFTAYLKNGSKKSMPHSEAWAHTSKYFTNYCQNCDILPIYSDFAIGDPWGIKTAISGETIVLCLNQNADELIKKTEKENYINLSPINKKQLILRLKKHFEIKQKRKKVAI